MTITEFPGAKLKKLGMALPISAHAHNDTVPNFSFWHKQKDISKSSD